MAQVTVADIIPDAEVKKLQAGREQEIVQPLLDLGYLSQNDFSDLAVAIRQFRLDYFSLELLPDFTPNFLFLPPTELESEELNLLHTLTALDGDFALESLPAIGEVNLCTRLIHYRLATLGLYSAAVEAPYSIASQTAMQKIRSWISALPTSSLDLLNLLGNIPHLIVHIDQHGGLERRIVAFRYDNPRVDQALTDEVAEADDEAEEEDATALASQEKEIDQNLNQLVEEIDSKETAEIYRLEHRNRKRRSKLIAVNDLMHKVHEEQNQRMAAAGVEGKMVTESLNNLREQEKLAQQKILIAENTIKQKKDFLKTCDQQIREIGKQQKKIRRLQGRQPVPREKIKALLNIINALRPSIGRRDTLLTEISQLQAQLPSLKESKKQISRQIKKQQKKFEGIIERMDTEQARLQSHFQKLKNQLERLEGKIDKLRFSFRARLRRVLDKDYYDNIVKVQIYRRRNRQFLEAISADEYNQFLIRLLQVFQWTNGYYYGKLDSDIGNRTFQSIDDLTNFTPRLRLKYILARLSNMHDGTKGFWILNIKYFIGKISEEIKSRKSDRTCGELLEEYEKNFLEEDGENRFGNEITDKAYAEFTKESQQGIRRRGIIRRIYYGIRGLASSLFKLIKGLVRLIKKGIKFLIYLVKNLIKIVYKEIREGIRKFRRGLHFLFGKRQFVTNFGEDQFVASKFDFDFDAVSFAPPTPPTSIVKTHCKTLLTYSNALDFTMVLTGRILKWTWRLIELQSPITWAKLALRVAIYFKNLIIEWLLGRGKRRAKRPVIRILYKLVT